MSTLARDDEGEILKLLEILTAACNHEVIEERSKAQRTPLMNACIKGNMKAAQILIGAGANYKVSTESGSPLILATESGNIQLVDYLRKLPGSPSLNDGD